LSTPDPKQWDIWFASLREGIRGEQTFDHHVLVVSSVGIRRDSRTVVVAPITTTHRDVPWLVEIDPPDSGLHARSWIECDQLQALAPSPLRFKTFRRRLAESRRPYVALALRHVLDGAL
jgi:mRNA-degrading endonuclease toxin of MazEF toxin-antitoxin module